MIVSCGVKKTILKTRIKNRFTKPIVAAIVLLLFLSGCGNIGENETSRHLDTNQVEHETESIAESVNKIQNDVTKESQVFESAEVSSSNGNFANQENQTADELTIIMVGDILLHTKVSDSGKQGDGTYNYDHLFLHTKDEIQKFDIAIANQEVILGGTELGLSGYPSFNGAYEVGDSLVEAGFDVVLHATNHALDKGSKGIINCLNYWKQNHPQTGVLGINESQKEQDQDIYIIDKKGIKVAILNYAFGTNGIEMPKDMPYLVDLLDKDKIEKDVSQAKKQADFVIVCPHWGTEYKHSISKEQTYWTNIFLESGVDLVIGTHPHVIEPVEWLEDQNGHRMLVYYSLGNFINATNETGPLVADRMLGEMAEVTLCKDNTGAVSISSYKAVPIVTQMLTGTGNITTYKLADYTEELAMQNEIIRQDSSFSLQYCLELWKREGF